MNREVAGTKEKEGEVKWLRRGLEEEEGLRGTRDKRWLRTCPAMERMWGGVTNFCPDVTAADLSYQCYYNYNTLLLLN